MEKKKRKKASKTSALVIRLQTCLRDGVHDERLLATCQIIVTTRLIYVLAEYSIGLNMLKGKLKRWNNIISNLGRTES